MERLSKKKFIQLTSDSSSSRVFNFFVVIAHGEAKSTFTVPEETVIFQTAQLGEVCYVSYAEHFAKIFLDDEQTALTTRTIFGLFGPRAEGLLGRINEHDRYKHMSVQFARNDTVDKELSYNDAEIAERISSANPRKLLNYEKPWGIHMMNREDPQSFDMITTLGGSPVDDLFKAKTTTEEVTEFINREYPSQLNIIFFLNCSPVYLEKASPHILSHFAKLLEPNYMTEPKNRDIKNPPPTAIETIERSNDPYPFHDKIYVRREPSDGKVYQITNKPGSPRTRVLDIVNSLVKVIKTPLFSFYFREVGDPKAYILRGFDLFDSYGIDLLDPAQVKLCFRTFTSQEELIAWEQVHFHEYPNYTAFESLDPTYQNMSHFFESDEPLPNARNLARLEGVSEDFHNPPISFDLLRKNEAGEYEVLYGSAIEKSEHKLRVALSQIPNQSNNEDPNFRIGVNYMGQLGGVLTGYYPIKQFFNDRERIMGSPLHHAPRPSEGGRRKKTTKRRKNRGRGKRTLKK